MELLAISSARRRLFLNTQAIAARRRVVRRRVKK